jgi:hypothetical protein
MRQTQVDETTPGGSRSNGGHRGRLRRYLILGAAASAVAWAAGAGGAAAAASTATTAHQAAAVKPATMPAGAPNLGPNVYIFTPSMPQSQVQATVDAISSQQISNQFGTQRYALLFEPGTYGSAANPLIFQVGYYTEVAGLGTSPGAVTINGSIDVYNQCFPPTPPATTPNCIALDNFWRSLSNLTINVNNGAGCEGSADFWAVSQAAPMRRVQVNGNVSLMDYCHGQPDYASGGFIADSAFTGAGITNGSQQQFLVRNSNIDNWTNGVWNQVFSGVVGAPAQSFPTPPYTTLATSPVTQEKPFLQTDSAGRFSVFVPALQHNSAGTTWGSGPTPGTSLSIRKFFIASPSTSVLQIDLALALGKDLILTPGVYNLKAPIIVSRPNTVVLGLGFPTLVPQDGTAAMQVLGVPGVKLSGMIIDAGPVNSRVLLQVGGPLAQWTGSADDPTLVQDVFFRIGGATAGSATDSLVVNSSHVILDDIWAWRADHGAGVGWTANTADNGLTVNGNDVTAYGLFVEHYQKTEVSWNGQGGEVIFYQNENPYDPPSQAAWMVSPTQNGYPAFFIPSRVTSFQGYGMGSYSFFNQNVPIENAMAFQVPTTPGVAFHDLLTRYLSGAGGIDSVINGTGAPVNATNNGPTYLVSYP